MCGLVGIFPYHADAPPVDHEELLQIRERMFTRGPDGAGLWVSENRRVGLAHRRLSIIDLSESGAQPMVDPETGNRIVFNGEIYNYRLLREELAAVGHRFHSASDTEVLLKLYAVHGNEMLCKLRGMYAFAIWDCLRNGILLARDGFGIKPLYLADDGKTLRFASQVKALLAGGQIDTAPEPAGHVGFYLWGHVPEPYTLYRGIRALPPGSALWIDQSGRKEQVKFFSLSDELSHPPTQDQQITANNARQQLHAALLDSVRHHLVADVPVGVFLSAGLDSTTLTALAKQTGVQELNTVTLGFKEFANTENDEVSLAEAVAHEYNTTHNTRWIREKDFFASLDDLFKAMDQPSIDGVNTYFVCKAAHEAGLKVALSGLGGDELFGGYSTFQALPRMVRLFGSLSRIPGLGKGFRRVSAPLLKHLTSPKYAGLLEYGGDYAGAYLLRRGLFMPWELPQVLDDDMVCAGWNQLQTLPALNRTIEGMDDSRLKVSALETSWYMRNQLLRDSDWASMAHSLEVRVPLVDIELIRTVTHLVKGGDAPGKQDMAASSAITLPEAVLQRPKTGFTVPMREWLLKSQQRRDGQTQCGLRSWAVMLYEQQNS